MIFRDELSSSPEEHIIRQRSRRSLFREVSADLQNGKQEVVLFLYFPCRLQKHLSCQYCCSNTKVIISQELCSIIVVVEVDLIHVLLTDLLCW